KATPAGTDFSGSARRPVWRSRLPSSAKTSTAESVRVTASTILPPGEIATPAGAGPTETVCTTAGGDASRSMTEIWFPSIVLAGSAGSIRVAAVRIATDKSGASATDCGGPTTLAGASTRATSLAGTDAISNIVRLSLLSAGRTVTTPCRSSTLLSLAVTNHWRVGACAHAAFNTHARTIEVRILMFIGFTSQGLGR